MSKRLKRILCGILTVALGIGNLSAGNMADAGTVSEKGTGDTVTQTVVRTASFNPSNEFRLGNYKDGEWSGTDILVAGGTDGTYWGASEFTDEGAEKVTLEPVSGTGFGTARNGILTFAIPKNKEGKQIESVKLEMTVRNIKNINDAGSCLAIYGDSQKEVWKDASDGATLFRRSLDGMDFLGFTDKITVSSGKDVTTESNQVISLQSKKLTSYTKGIVGDPLYSNGELTFRLAPTCPGGTRIYSEYADEEKRPQLVVTYAEEEEDSKPTAKPTPTAEPTPTTEPTPVIPGETGKERLSAVRSVNFNSADEWRAGNYKEGEWGGSDLLLAGKTGTDWGVPAGTVFTDMDGTTTTLENVDGQDYFTPRNGVITFEMPKGEAVRIKSVKLKLTVRNVKQKAAGARLGIFGNSLKKRWSMQDTKSVFGAGTESGLAELDFLGLTSKVAVGNRNAVVTEAEQEITLESRKLTEYVRRIASDTTYCESELSFRLAPSDTGGVRVYSEYADEGKRPVLEITYSDEAVEFASVTVSSVDEEGKPLAEASEVKNVIAGEKYVYTSEPVPVIQTEDGVYYQFDRERSALTLDKVVKEGVNEIRLVYKKIGKDGENGFSVYSGDTLSKEGA